MTYVLVRDAGRVRTLTLNRPERRNALGQALFDELEVAVSETARWPGQVVVLEGAGPGFSAGADLKDDVGTHEGWQSTRVDLERWNRCLDELERLPQVTVASLHGAVVGGGAVLAAACDLRVASSDVAVTLPETYLGLPLAMGGLARLVREIGLPRTREAVLTRRVLDADTCLAWGLVHRVGDRAQLVAELVADLVSSPAPAQSMAKQALTRLGRASGPAEGVWSDADVLSLLRLAGQQAPERP